MRFGTTDADEIILGDEDYDAFDHPEGGNDSANDTIIAITPTQNPIAPTTIFATGGDDRIEFPRTGFAWGGQGNDTIVADFAERLYNGLWTYLLGQQGDDLIEGLGLGPPELSGTPRVYFSGGEGNDTLRGSDGPELLYGQEDDDAVFGGGGDDWVFDAHVLFLQFYTSWIPSGAETLDGGDGNDTIQSSGGPDRIFGGAGDDLINIGDRARVDGGAGRDRVLIFDESRIFADGARLRSTGFDRPPDGWTVLANIESVSWLGVYDLPARIDLPGVEVSATLGAGDDHVVIGGGTLRTGNGNDWVKVDGRYAHVMTEQGNDTIIATQGGFLEAGAGNDFVRIDSTAATGQVSAHLASGNDTFFGAALASDFLYFGNSGDDLIRLRGGDDGADGDTGNDDLDGGDGADTLLGGDGDDTLRGGSGYDSMVGGLGNDTYVVDAYGTNEIIQPQEGPLWVNIDPGDWTVEELDGGIDTVISSVTFLLAANIEKLRLSGLADIGGSGNDLANEITGNAGANSLAGLGGDDLLTGAQGNDTLVGGSGADTLTGGDGNDSLDGTAGRQVQLFGGAGDDVLRAGSSSFASAGNTRGDLLSGGAGNDLLEASAGPGNVDALVDTLQGGAGDDTLVGGAGADSMDGGAGADVFRYAAARGGDTITGYRPAEDSIEVSAAGFGGGLVAGMDLLAEGRFVAGGPADAPAGTGQFLWDAATRRLSWDADGAGGVGAVTLAVLPGVRGFGAGEIVVIA